MRPELLSPAGSPEALRAAVESGADAVYLGWGSFNARQSAKNFSDEEFALALAYCHERGVKVYLTLNTLVSDREVDAALACARAAADLGVDAVLVQDMGLFSLLRAALPDLPLHASTQMSLFTLGGAQEAAADGCRRVVLARECSRDETAAICRGCSAEIETFVHGALCMCYSGQCAMSALIGGRSGNRGRCAQPCRLPYTVVETDAPGGPPPQSPLPKLSGTPGPCAYPLSLKDNCLAFALSDMERMGVACLKLEGRMKRAEYVAVVTGIYARLLSERRGSTAAESAALEAAFSRSGFTDGYWRGNAGPALFGVRPPDAPEPKELFASARAAVEKGGLRTVPLSMTAEFRRDCPCSLTVADGDGHTVTVHGPVPEAARNRAVTAEELEARLQKTGGTAYRCEHVSCAVDEGLSLSASAVNALRREGLAALSALRTAPKPQRHLPSPPLPAPIPAVSAPALTCSLSRAEQLTKELLSLKPARVYLPLELCAALSAPVTETELCAILPRVWRDRDEPLMRSLLERARERGVSSALIGNLGHLPLLRDMGLTLYGDFGLNVFNARTLDYYRKKGLSSATLSFELRASQMRDLPKVLPTEAIVYGRLPLMITENCLIRNSGGCDCAHGHALWDRTGAQFPLLPVFGHRTEIQNSKRLFLADREDWKKLGLSYARLRFTTETPAQCAQIFSAYQTGGAAPEDLTRGLFDRGVE